MEVGSAYSTVSLSTGPGGEEDLDPLETIGGEDEGFERSEQRAALEPALDWLPPREREILRMRFEEGLPQTQIAQRVGLPRCTSRGSFASLAGYARGTSAHTSERDELTRKRVKRRCWFV